MGSLQAWSNDKFGSIRMQLKDLREKLGSVQGGADDASRAEAKGIAAEMNERESRFSLRKKRDEV